MQERQVDVGVGTDQLGIERAAIRESHADKPRVVYDVLIGENVPVWRDYDPGAD